MREDLARAPGDVLAANAREDAEHATGGVLAANARADAAHATGEVLAADERGERVLDDDDDAAAARHAHGHGRLHADERDERRVMDDSLMDGGREAAEERPLFDDADAGTLLEFGLRDDGFDPFGLDGGAPPLHASEDGAPEDDDTPEDGAPEDGAPEDGVSEDEIENESADDEADGARGDEADGSRGDEADGARVDEADRTRGDEADGARGGGGGGGGGAASEEDEEASPNRLLPAQYGDNTPKRGGAARRGVDLGRSCLMRNPQSVWHSIRRLKDVKLRSATRLRAGKLVQVDYTHVCLLCWEKLKLGYDTKASSWKTTMGLKHLRDTHELGDKNAAEVKAKTSSDARSAHKVQGMFAAGASSAGASASSACATFGISPREHALTKAARYYIYGRGRVSKETFNDPEFKNMLKGYYVAAGGRPDDCPFLTTKMLVEYVRAEFHCFIVMVREFSRMQFEYSLGNPWAQLIHDAATLANHVKSLASGIEAIDPLLLENHTICLGMDPLASGHDAANATLLRKVFERAEIGSVEEVAHSSIEDRAARYVAELFEHDKDDVCGMHDTDKIGKRAIGDLTRKKNGRIIDPFPTGQELIKKVHNQV